MIVVLCNTFQDAKDAFDVFMDFLENTEPFTITRVFEHSYCVETDEDLRYIFIDYHLAPVFRVFGDSDEIEMDEFFEDLGEYCVRRGYL